MTKGVETRERIIDRALGVASARGLEGVSLGQLAAAVGMSKSGLFAHFRSKEELALAVLSTASARFAEVVVRPALAAPRGEPRLRALFERWMAWDEEAGLPGGCVFVQLSAELHERPGATRDALAAAEAQWLDLLAKATRLAVEAGHFRTDLDPALFAFQLHGILLAYYHRRRLLRRDEEARRLADAAFESLLAQARPTLPPFDTD